MEKENDKYDKGKERKCRSFGKKKKKVGEFK